MSGAAPGGVLLALDAGIRESGWAVLGAGRAPVTGVVRTAQRRGLDARGRIDRLVESLDLLAEEWRPLEVVHCRPSGIRWRVPSLELLEASLFQWAGKRGLPLHGYTAQEVRAAMAGRPNVSKDRLGYAVMLRMGLIGQARTTHEWEALAVGWYHLSLRGGQFAGDGFSAQSR